MGFGHEADIALELAVRVAPSTFDLWAAALHDGQWETPSAQVTGDAPEAREEEVLAPRSCRALSRCPLQRQPEIAQQEISMAIFVPSSKSLASAPLTSHTKPRCFNKRHSADTVMAPKAL